MYPRTFLRHRVDARGGPVLVALCVSLLLLAGCATGPGQSRAAAAKDPLPRLAILSAFAPELEKLVNQTRLERRETINGRSYYIGELAGHRVVLLLSGYSMVNASMTAQTLLDHFTVRQIIFSGIAGGVNPALRIGDVVVPAEWAQYQEQQFARQTPGGWQLINAVTNLGHFGMMFPQPSLVTRRDSPPDQEEARFWFPCDPSSLEIVRSITNQVVLESATRQGTRLKSVPRVVVGGKGVSGPTFVNNAGYREWVWQNFHADALDMESAAVATVAYVNHVPFIAFRSLSDLAGGGEGENEVLTFLELAAANSAAVVLQYLQSLPKQHELTSSGLGSTRSGSGGTGQNRGRYPGPSLNQKITPP